MPTARGGSAAVRAVEAARARILSTNYRELAAARAALERLAAAWTRRPRPEREVAQLWVLYAQLERELRQFGRAASVFERAVACPVAGREPLVWAEYARFCAGRCRLASARKVFKRGLRALQGERREALLRSFHAFAADYMGVTLPLDAFRRCVFPPDADVRPSLALPSTGSKLRQIWAAAMEQMELPSPATASTVSSVSDCARLEDGGSASDSSTSGLATSDKQDEERPGESVGDLLGPRQTAATHSAGHASASTSKSLALGSATERERERERLRLRAERRREQVECEFCRRLFRRASKRSHSIRCRLKLGVAMSAEDRLVADAFLEKERRKRARTYRNRKARERGASA